MTSRREKASEKTLPFIIDCFPPEFFWGSYPQKMSLRKAFGGVELGGREETKGTHGANGDSEREVGKK